MSARRLRRASVSSAVVSILAGSPAFGGFALNTLGTFNGANGQYPGGGLTSLDGFLYGTTSQGGANGAGIVFAVPMTGGSPILEASFNGSNGETPSSGVFLGPGGNLFGTAAYGGAGDGTVYSVFPGDDDPDPGSLAVLASFNGSNGATPVGGFVRSAKMIYGVTQNGGTNGDGTVFKVAALEIAPSPDVLVSFNGSNGSHPDSGLILSGTNLYGTTQSGGAYGDGAVFSVPTVGGSPTVLASFNGSNGATPDSGLTLSGTTLYGTTHDGGADGLGTVFSIPITGGTPTVLASFNGANGENPSDGVTLLADALYGTTLNGGANNVGTVYSVPISGGSPKMLVSFNGTNGQMPSGGLSVLGSTLYGTTEYGGGGDGTVFSLTSSPILSFTTAAPTAFGSQIGTLAFTHENGSYSVATATFAATSAGYLPVSGFGPNTLTLYFALDIADSVPGNLAADLADAAAELNAANYSGYLLTASTTDPTGEFGSGYDFFITITDPTLGTSSPFFGFDLTQLNGTSDTLTVTSVAAVPEPASVSLLAVGSVALLRRRRVSLPR